MGEANGIRKSKPLILLKVDLFLEKVSHLAVTTKATKFSSLSLGAFGLHFHFKFISSSS